MYLLCMIKARIRWCTCRVENILTLGKLLSMWFCFLLHSIMFLRSQTAYRTYKIISSYELARPVMGTIFLVYIYRNSRLDRPGSVSLANNRRFKQYSEIIPVEFQYISYGTELILKGVVHNKLYKSSAWHNDPKSC